MSNHDGVAVADGYREAAARRGGGGGFTVVRNHRRLRVALHFAAWGLGGIISSTVPNLAANPDHVMVYFLVLMAAVLLLLLSMAADDTPRLEPAAARLEGILAHALMINLGDHKLRTLLARGAAGLPILIAGKITERLNRLKLRFANAARRGGGLLHDLRNRRSKIIFYYAGWGLAGIMSTTVAILSVNTTVPILSVMNTTVPILSVNTTVPSLPVNPDHRMLYVLFLIAGVMLLLLTIAAAADMPWMEGLAARLESLLEAMIKVDF